MLTTLPLLAALALAPSQAGDLSLTDARVTYGILGPTRDNTKFLPGDALYVTFTIDGITAAADGKVLYSIATEVTDAAGKSVHKQPPQDLEAVNALGGTSLPAFAQVAIGLESPAGENTLKVTVTDRATKKSATLTQKFEVQKPAFGLVRLKTSSDAEGQVPAGMLGVGQSLWVSGAVVGFQRGGAMKQPNVSLELTVLDEKGKPTLAKPFTGTIDKGVAANEMSLPAQFLVSLNRAGKFTVQVKTTDALSGKSVTQSFPITVHSGK